MNRRRRSDLLIEGDRESLHIATALGRVVRAARRQRRLTQADLGTAVGLGHSRVGEIERGTAMGTPLIVWVRLGMVLGRPLSMSFSRDLDPPVPADSGHLAGQELVLRLARELGRPGSFELPTRPDNPSLSVDACVRDDPEGTLILHEIWNRFDDLGRAARSTDRKVAEATEMAIGLGGDRPYRVAHCWLLVDTAANRNAALPAIRTQQMDGGVRWALTKDLKLVAGLFEVKKPYFNTNESNIFTTLGDVRHRGLEVSLNGMPHPDWSVVAGAVLMEPRVTGEPVREGRIGKKPVGQTERLLRLNVEYRPPALRALSVDLAVANYGERVASNDGLAVLPDYTILDIGARYRMKFGDRPATFRFWVGNVTDQFFWDVSASNSFGLSDGRRYAATLFVDI